LIELATILDTDELGQIQKRPAMIQRNETEPFQGCLLSLQILHRQNWPAINWYVLIVI